MQQIDLVPLTEEEKIACLPEQEISSEVLIEKYAKGGETTVADVHLSLREGYGAQDLRADVLAGLTVAIVALPLSMAIAIASGLGPERGRFAVPATLHVPGVDRRVQCIQVRHGRHGIGKFREAFHHVG